MPGIPSEAKYRVRPSRLRMGNISLRPDSMLLLRISGTDHTVLSLRVEVHRFHAPVSSGAEKTVLFSPDGKYMAV